MERRDLYQEEEEKEAVAVVSRLTGLLARHESRGQEEVQQWATQTSSPVSGPMHIFLPYSYHTVYSMRTDDG